VDAQQFIVAKYLYDPFGNTLSISGPVAALNMYRFASQEYHANSGLILYLRRAYDPNLQRWLNRDPISEFGGANLFGYVGNSPVNYADWLGLEITYFYGKQVTSPLYPSGSVPYLTGDNIFENLVSGVYNSIPFVNNSVQQLLEPVNTLINGISDVTAAATGDQEVGNGVKRVLTVGMMFLPEDCPSAPGKATTAAATADGDAYQLPGYVPNESVIVKGGTKPPPVPGEEFSISYGVTLDEAGAGVPHGQIQPSTAGQIRANGGTVTPAPEMTGDTMNYQHANVVEGDTPTVFGPPIPNPVSKPNRIGGPKYGK
jgi:RHS repeat-associated protein